MHYNEFGQQNIIFVSTLTFFLKRINIIGMIFTDGILFCGKKQKSTPMAGGTYSKHDDDRDTVGRSLQVVRGAHTRRHATCL